MGGFWQGNEIACILELQILCPNTPQHLLRDVPTAEPPPRCSSTRSAAPHQELAVRGFRHPA